MPNIITSCGVRYCSPAVILVLGCSKDNITEYVKKKGFFGLLYKRQSNDYHDKAVKNDPSAQTPVECRSSSYPSVLSSEVRRLEAMFVSTREELVWSCLFMQHVLYILFPHTHFTGHHYINLVLKLKMGDVISILLSCSTSSICCFIYS